MDETQSRAGNSLSGVQDSTFLGDVIRGLSSSPKRISPKYFYDECGSALFEEITRQPEYYVTRCELSILDEAAAQIEAYLPQDCVIVEFGSGSSRKIRRLLRSSSKITGYVPVDISPEMLKVETAEVARDYPDLRVAPVAADFTRRFALPAWALSRPRVGFFPGSTIGNFDPIDAQRLLSDAARSLGPGSLFVVGVDLVKDSAVLDAAYNDAAGVTAKFNLNVLARCNRELGSNFELENFRHRAFFRSDMNRIEMHLVSTLRQFVRIGEVNFSFDRSESVHTENSYKYTVSGFRDLARIAGWQPLDVLTDSKTYFSVHILGRA